MPLPAEASMCEDGGSRSGKMDQKSRYDTSARADDDERITDKRQVSTTVQQVGEYSTSSRRSCASFVEKRGGVGAKVKQVKQAQAKARKRQQPTRPVTTAAIQPRKKEGHARTLHLFNEEAVVRASEPLSLSLENENPTRASSSTQRAAEFLLNTVTCSSNSK